MKNTEPQDQIEIIGGRPLKGGRVKIAGSSNQVTKAMIASLLTDEPVTIKSAPSVDERRNVEKLLTSIGGSVEVLEENTLRLTAKGVDKWEIPTEICQQNRISILVAGPLLHRFKKVSLSAFLGGDKIGKRPVNFHVNALEQMGAKVRIENGRYIMTVDEDGLQGASIELPFPSVMTTENIMMTGVLAQGRTVIHNAAVEPEIIELAKMLQKMGANIKFTPNRTILIEGVKKLRGCELRCMIDRNQAVSFAVAALATGGDVLLEDVPHDSVFSFINFIQNMGAEFRINSDGLYVKAPTHKKYLPAHVEVDVHPGFMTDWQQPFMVLFTQALGVSVVHETVFEERLKYTEFLNQMGANISLSSACLGETSCRFKGRNFIHSAIIQGPTPLHGADFVLPTDIRAGKCLVIAGLTAEGKTRLTNIKELSRKYDRLVDKLKDMGADIKTNEATRKT